MKPQPPTRSPYASDQIRSEARSYVAQLRAQRLARVQGAAPQAVPVAPPSEGAATKRPKHASKAPAKTNGKKIGKRGIRIDVAHLEEAPKSAPLTKKTIDADSPAPPKQESPRESVRSGASKARAAARDAQQKLRAARLKQREAAAKQREAASRAKADQRSARTRPASSLTQRRWTPARSAAQAAPPKAVPVQPAANAAALIQLRGIGEAMCRRLEQAGIDSLPVLVDLPPSIIRERLGPVSALANVEGWQAEAKTLLSPSEK
ncbi:MAG: hypothetical protein AAF221_05895 [Pseudomonadota bacterium]